MFGWLKPRVPLETREKTWTELRMAGAVRLLGLDRVRRAKLIVPDEAFLPASVLTEDELRKLFDRIGTRMGVATGERTVRVFDESDRSQLPEPDDADSPRTIWVPLSIARSPTQLVAALASALAGVLVETTQQATGSGPSDEGVTSLVPTALGLGLFTIDALVQEFREDHAHHQRGYVNRLGYLNSSVVSYALALFAFLRGEEEPDWMRWLGPDEAAVFRGGLRYLKATGDSLCHSDTVRNQQRSLALADVLTDLETGTPTRQLATLWRIADERFVHAELLAPLRKLLRDRDADILSASAQALAIQGQKALEAVADLIRTIRRLDGRARLEVARSLVALHPPAGEVLAVLEGFVTESGDLALIGLQGLRSYGPESAPAAVTLYRSLVRAEVDCQENLAHAAADAIISLAGAADEVAQEIIGSLDSDLQGLVHADLEAARERAAAAT